MALEHRMHSIKMVVLYSSMYVFVCAFVCVRECVFNSNQAETIARCFCLFGIQFSSYILAISDGCLDAILDKLCQLMKFWKVPKAHHK